MQLPSKKVIDADDAIKDLEQQIALLEAELHQLETAVHTYHAQIRYALADQIEQIQALTNRYKNQKNAKKLKRLEQKKRGKNYKEPTGLKVINTASKEAYSSENQQEMKRLYKEAIVQIHPDKFADADDDLNERATAVTILLNEIYKNGNLKELNRLHGHIISGNALNYIPDQPETVNNLQAMMLFLQHKKSDLTELLRKTRDSEIYKLMMSGKSLENVIIELSNAFDERIKILQKRTK